jgi:hypothetical protein
MAPDMRFRVQPLAFHLGLDEHRDQVLAGLQPPSGRQLLGVAEDLHGRLARVGPLDLVLGVVRADHPVGPVEDLAPVLLGHPEQLGDDQQGELGRDLLDEVGRAALAHRVDDAVGVPDDLLLQIAHQLRGEALVDQTTVAGVHGRVHVEHHQLLLGQLLVVHVGEESRMLGRGEALPVPVHRDAVVVVGNGPEATPVGRRLGMPVDRGFGPEPAEPLVGDAGHEVAPVDEVDLFETHGPPFSRPKRPAVAAGRAPPLGGNF